MHIKIKNSGDNTVIKNLALFGTLILRFRCSLKATLKQFLDPVFMKNPFTLPCNSLILTVVTVLTKYKGD